MRAHAHVLVYIHVRQIDEHLICSILECDDFCLNNEPHIVCRLVTNQKHPVSHVTCLFNLLCVCDYLQPHNHTSYVISTLTVKIAKLVTDFFFIIIVFSFILDDQTGLKFNTKRNKKEEIFL